MSSLSSAFTYFVTHYSHTYGKLEVFIFSVNDMGELINVLPQNKQLQQII
jgi:hypothetical protein